MKHVNLMRSCQCNNEPSTKLTVSLFTQVTAILLVVGLGTGYTFAALNQFSTEVKQMLKIEPRPLKLQKIKIDVNNIDRKSRTA